ncbi:MAG TPA: FG-GAP-like repeat-containing protein [Kofleriaceae bacterium]
MARRWGALALIAAGALGACASEPMNPGPIPPALSIPRLQTPAANAYVGSVHAAGSLRPTFRWAATSEDPAVSYRLQISSEASFTAFVTTIPTATTSYQPAIDLPVDRTVPVGTRYYWRVCACRDTTCWPYSPARALNLGRSDRDVNGDGFADVVVGSAGYASDTVGKVYVYFGGAEPTLDPIPDGTLVAPTTKDFFGTAVAIAGDINGDGFADIIVGASDEGNGGAGAAYLYYGGPGPVFDGTADQVLHGVVPGDLFGLTVASAGDVNGDGFADVLIGAPWADGMKGTVYVGLGGLGGISTSRVLSGTSTKDPYERSFGLGVSSIGDLDGDGYGDLAIAINTVTGVAGYLYFGDPTTSLDAPIAIRAGGVGPIVGVGDLDGDGFADLAIQDQGSAGGDAVTLHFGNERRDLAGAGVTITQQEPGFGASIAPAGDINGDGFADVVVGADPDYEGRFGGAFLYLGGPQGMFANVAAGSILGTPSRFASWNVAPAGDVNGDGVDDIVIGGGIVPASPVQRQVWVYQGQAINVFQRTPYGTLTDLTDPPNIDYGVVVAH